MFHKIKNKLESQKLIEKKGLNYNPYIILKEDSPTMEVLEFISRYEELAIRDPRPMGKFHHCIPQAKVLDVLAGYDSIIGLRLQPSLKRYDDEFLVLQGDIEVGRFTTQVKATLNDAPGVSLREATNNPNLYKTYQWNWVEDKDPEITGLRQIMNYIFKHELFDMIVEFTIYSRPVGKNNENLIIWELRNY